jgi:protein involved in plasmid replication-relaxation
MKQENTAAMRTAQQKIISDLADFQYLTVSQLLTLEEYKESSRSYVYKQVNELVAEDLVLALPRQAVTQPRLYILTSRGRRVAIQLGKAPYKRFRVGEEKERGENTYFVAHTIAVTNVLIAARLLAKTVPAIRLNRMLTERELQRTIYVSLPGERKLCIEPDGALDFIVKGTWRDFCYLEVYRHHLNETRFQHKIQGYVTALITGLHEQLFATSAMTVAVIATTQKLKETLKHWAEDALVAMDRQDAGERFFFCHLDTATASPEELFLSPLWQNAFSDGKTPLLVLE